MTQALPLLESIIPGRSIEYAVEQAKSNHKDIKYVYMNYLDIDYENEFDFVTLIYCEFGVLPTAERAKLLIKIRKALKKDGFLILDGFTENKIPKFFRDPYHPV